MEEKKYYILVIKDLKTEKGLLSGIEDYGKCIELGLWGIRENIPYELKLGDKVVFYYAGRKGGKFLGAATVSSKLHTFTVEETENRRSFYKDDVPDKEILKTGISLGDVIDWSKGPKQLDSLLRSKLNFITNKDNWGSHLQGGVKIIPKEDFLTIMEEQFKEPEENIEPGHSEIQYYLCRLGRILGYDVYVPLADFTKNNETKVGRLKDVVTIQEVPPFVTPRIMEKVKNIDVIWFKGEIPIACFEVEHTTDISKGLGRLYQLQILNDIMLFIISREKMREKFNRETAVQPYYDERERYQFRNYDEVIEFVKIAETYDNEKFKFLNSA